MADNDARFELWDRLWAAISRNEKEMAVLKVQFNNLKEEVDEIQNDFESHLQDKITNIKTKEDRKSNRKIMMIGGGFAILVALIEIVPMLWK